jgi:pyruvate kinase
VANACFDLASAVMLSGETAIGKFPVLVVKTMRRIIKKVEESYHYEDFLRTQRESFDMNDQTGILAYNAVSTAYQLKAKSLVVFTNSGYSARMVSRVRPGLPIHAITLHEWVYHQLALAWGVFPHLIDDVDDFEELVKRALNILVTDEHLVIGDRVIIVAAVPLGLHGETNMIRVETIR